ncbi:MAG: hypothetical protein ABIH23_09320 [bacterium]
MRFGQRVTRNELSCNIVETSRFLSTEVGMVLSKVVELEGLHKVGPASLPVIVVDNLEGRPALKWVVRPETVNAPAYPRLMTR